MKRMFILSFLLGSLLFLTNCQKSVKDITIADYLGAEKEKYKEIISKDLSFKSIDTIDIAIERYKKNSKLDEFKNNNIIWLLSEQRDFDKLMKPRKELYDIALKSLIAGLRFPNSAKIPQVDLVNNDDVIIDKDTSMKKGEYYNVKIRYQAQNGFGAFIDGLYKSNIKRDSTNKLVEWFGYNI